MSTQIQMFPISCAEVGHEYSSSGGEGYYKEDSKGERFTKQVFRMIFCIKCGDNKEIMVVNRIPLAETFPKPKTSRIMKKKRK